jgi:type VI secretion system secreted protein VgrG
VTHHLHVAGNDQLEMYDYPGGYAERFDGVDPGGEDDPEELAKIQPDAARTAGIRMAEEAAAGLVVDGTSTARNLAGGHKFTLRRHFNGDGAYVLTDVHHSASLSGDSALEYRNTFSCIPVGLPYRPPRLTPHPVIPGSQTAVVVGPAGEQVHADKYGRVKVKFYWDREGQNDANSSCWIRVGALHAGQEGGFTASPSIGEEVVVCFEEGNPDRPLITGSVYNPDRLPPPRPVP